MHLDHLLTRSSKVYHDSFCQLDSSVSLPWVIHFEAFYLHVVSSFSCIPVICPKFVLFLTPLQFVNLFCNLSQVYPAVLLMYFISAAVILLPSLASTVQVSLPYNQTGRASVLYNFILVYYHHHYHHHHISATQLGHLLTRSSLTHPEVSSKVYHDSFCQLDSSVSLPWVIYFEAFYLHVESSFSCIPVICPKLVLFLTPLQFVHLFCNLSQVYPAVLLEYQI